jgi:hypothetical protein
MDLIPEEQRSAAVVRWSPEIQLGHILQAVVMLVGRQPIRDGQISVAERR